LGFREVFINRGVACFFLGSRELCSSHASTTATCEQSRPRKEGKDQASSTYKWLAYTWK